MKFDQEQDRWVECELNEKRSTVAGEEGPRVLTVTFSDASSRDMLAFPFLTDVGIKDRCACSAMSSLDDLLDVSLVTSLKTSPGPFPLPRICSGAAFTGAANFGAGSIENRAEDPAPRDSVRSFLAGRASFSSYRDESFVSVGRLIAIFLRAFLAFGAGRESLEDEGTGRESGEELFSLSSGVVE